MGIFTYKKRKKSPEKVVNVPPMLWRGILFFLELPSDQVKLGDVSTIENFQAIF